MPSFWWRLPPNQLCNKYKVMHVAHYFPYPYLWKKKCGLFGQLDWNNLPYTLLVLGFFNVASQHVFSFLKNNLQWCKLKLLIKRNALWLSWQKFCNLKFRLNKILQVLTYENICFLINFISLSFVTNLNHTILYSDKNETGTSFWVFGLSSS